MQVPCQDVEGDRQKRSGPADVCINLVQHWGENRPRTSTDWSRPANENHASATSKQDILDLGRDLLECTGRTICALLQMGCKIRRQPVKA